MRIYYRGGTLMTYFMYTHTRSKFCLHEFGRACSTTTALLDHFCTFLFVGFGFPRSKIKPYYLVYPSVTRLYSFTDVVFPLLL